MSWGLVRLSEIAETTLSEVLSVRTIWRWRAICLWSIEPVSAFTNHFAVDAVEHDLGDGCAIVAARQGSAVNAQPFHGAFGDIHAPPNTMG